MTDDSDEAESSGDGSGGDSSNGGESGGDDQTSTAEKVVMVVSAAVTISLFLFAAYQLVTAPAAEAPTVRVVGTEPTADGAVVVTIELSNRMDVGLRSVTVGVACDDPPPTVTFDNVPVDGQRRGEIRCPSGTDSPEVTVESWIER